MKEEIEKIKLTLANLQRAFIESQKCNVNVVAKADTTVMLSEQTTNNTSDIADNSVGIYDLAEVVSDDSVSIYELAELISDLDARVSALEEK